MSPTNHSSRPMTSWSPKQNAHCCSSIRPMWSFPNGPKTGWDTPVIPNHNPSPCPSMTSDTSFRWKTQRLERCKTSLSSTLMPPGPTPSEVSTASSQDSLAMSPAWTSKSLGHWRKSLSSPTAKWTQHAWRLRPAHSHPHWSTHLCPQPSLMSCATNTPDSALDTIRNTSKRR